MKRNRPDDDTHCYGCDKLFPRKCYHDEHVSKCEHCEADTRAFAEVLLAPEKKAMVCASTRYSMYDRRDPLVNCARLAQARANACPGCGGHGVSISDGRRFSVCADCTRALERDRIRAAEDAEAKKLYSVYDSYRIFPRVGWGETGGLVLLAEAAGGRVLHEYRPAEDYGHNVDDNPNLTPTAKNSRGEDSYIGIGSDSSTVEIRASQAPALKRFFGWLAAVVEERYAEGKRDGLDLLGQLSRGEVSTAEFDARAKS